MTEGTCPFCGSENMEKLNGWLPFRCLSCGHKFKIPAKQAQQPKPEQTQANYGYRSPPFNLKQPEPQRKTSTLEQLEQTSKQIRNIERNLF